MANNHDINNEEQFDPNEPYRVLPKTDEEKELFAKAIKFGVDTDTGKPNTMDFSASVTELIEGVVKDTDSNLPLEIGADIFKGRAEFIFNNYFNYLNNHTDGIFGTCSKDYYFRVIPNTYLDKNGNLVDILSYQSHILPWLMLSQISSISAEYYDKVQEAKAHLFRQWARVLVAEENDIQVEFSALYLKVYFTITEIINVLAKEAIELLPKEEGAPKETIAPLFIPNI